MSKFKTAYDDPCVVELRFGDEMVTKQCFKDECDINLIMKNADQSGFLSHLIPSEPLYMDVSSIGQYKESLDFIKSTDEAFMDLSAHLRLRFDNDAGKFLDFVSDPSNEKEMIELGILDPHHELKAPMVNSAGENLPEVPEKTPKDV